MKKPSMNITKRIELMLKAEGIASGSPAALIQQMFRAPSFNPDHSMTVSDFAIYLSKEMTAITVYVNSEGRWSFDNHPKNLQADLLEAIINHELKESSSCYPPQWARAYFQQHLD